MSIEHEEPSITQFAPPVATDALYDHVDEMVPLDVGADGLVGEETASRLMVPAPRRATLRPMPAMQVLADNGSNLYQTARRTIDPWAQCFHNSRLLGVRIPRPRLYQGLLDSTARWINYSAAPGMGRSTLLQQIADELEEAGAPYMALWDARQARTLLSEIRHALHDGSAIKEMTERAAAHPSGRFTLLVDDYDLLVTREYLDIARQLFAAVPGFRVITTTLNPLDRSALAKESFTFEFREIPAAQLYFNLEETQEFLDNAAAALQRPALAAECVQAIFEVTGGIPLGVALGAEHNAIEQTEIVSVFARMMLEIRNYTESYYPQEILNSGYSMLLSVFALMPRFKSRQIAQLFPELPAGQLQQLLAMPELRSNGGHRSGEYIWAERFWQLTREWQVPAAEKRQRLASRLLQIGEAGAAFEQWLFAGDFRRCEKVLAERFFTVFEELTPEAEQLVLLLTREELRGCPFLRVFCILLDAQASHEELNTASDNLAWLAQKLGTASALLCKALRAAVLLRQGQWQGAAAQAEAILAACPSRAEFARIESDSERLSYAEASLLATLVLFGCGTYPQGDAQIPSCGGCNYLSARRGLAQMLLDIARQPFRRSMDVVTRNSVAGYRSLVFSPADCVQDIEAFAGGDRYLNEVIDAVRARQDPPAEGGVGNDEPLVLPVRAAGEGVHVPASYASLVACYRLLRKGDLPGAVQLVAKDQLAAPGSELARAMVHLAKGEPAKALEQLETIQARWGGRAGALALVLRACALMRRGQIEPARLTLFQSEYFAESTVAEGLSLVPDEEQRALVGLHDQLAIAFSVAQAVGVFGMVTAGVEASPMRALTKKEQLVLDGLRRGLNTREIADESYLSVNTVRTHVRAISKKLGASGQADILRRAWELKLIDE